MKRTVLLVFLLMFVNLSFSHPLFLLSSQTPHFTIEFYYDNIKLSMSQSFLYNSLPIDWFLPKQNPEILKGLISVESGFYVHAVSPVGALGLTQLMPVTAKEAGVRNAFSVFESIDGANLYLSKLLNQFGDAKLALAAYNEGPNRVRSQGPSPNGVTYAEKILAESKRLAGKSVPLRDVFYIEPHLRIGNVFGVGVEMGFSLLGVADFTVSAAYQEGFRHSVVVYPRLTHELALMVGEKDSNFLFGVSYEQLRNFGVEFYLTHDDMSLTSYLKVWKLFVKFGYSLKNGLCIGVMK